MIAIVGFVAVAFAGTTAKKAAKEVRALVEAYSFTLTDFETGEVFEIDAEA